MSKHHRQSKVNYRKIYENHFGKIPKGYHIHHIDGDPYNNDISNLQCITAEEHAKIHEKEWILWASKAGEFISSEGLKRKQEAGILSGKKNAEKKIGIHDDHVREKTRILHSKKWRIVSPSRNLDVTVLSLNRWCDENNVSRNGMNGAYRNNRPYDDYYPLQVSKNESIEEKYIPRIHKNSRKHQIEKESGTIIHVVNLIEWCIENEISREGLRSASKRGKFYKGYRLLKVHS